jgi:hypothetical protein
MIDIIIPADKFPGLASDGTKTFAGVLQSYFSKRNWLGKNIGISSDWDDKYAAQYSRDYLRRLLPVIVSLYGLQKPMHEYCAEDFERILEELKRRHHYADSTIEKYRRLLLKVYKAGVANKDYPDNIMWDIPDEENGEGDQEVNRIRVLTKLRKSFSVQEDLRMLQWFSSLKPETVQGVELGLALMYFLGLRDNESCGASFGDFRAMKNHSDMAVFIMGNTTSLGSNLLKPSGKTSNAPRQLPISMFIYELIEARKKVVQNEIDAGRIALTKEMDSIDKFPIVCKGSDFSCRAHTADLSVAGRTLFENVGISKSELQWLYDTLWSEDFQDSIIDEKDPTPYLCRRNTVTRMYHLGFEWKDIQYWIAHDIESVEEMRNYYSDEETLYELGKAYEKHPIFEILTAMREEASEALNEIPTDGHYYQLQAGRTSIVEVEAREPNVPVIVSAKSEQPFSVIETTKEAYDLPDRLVPIENLLRKVYWKMYRRTKNKK